MSDSDRQAFRDRRASEVSSALEQKVDQMLDNQREDRKTLRELTNAVQKLAVIEERQSNDREAVGRAFQEIAQLEVKHNELAKGTDSRLKRLEESAPITSMANSAVFKVVALVLAAVIGALLSGLLKPAPQQPPIMIQGAPATAPLPGGVK